VHFSSSLRLLPAPLFSSSLILSPKYYLVRSTNYEATQCALYSFSLSLIDPNIFHRTLHSEHSVSFLHIR
jgi:hypothetical protein